MVCGKQTQKKKNEVEDKTCEMSQEDQLKENFFLPLIDHEICCLIDCFEQIPTVGAIFNFHSNQENLLREYEHSRVSNAWQNFYKL